MEVKLMVSGAALTAALGWALKVFFDRCLGAIDKNTEAISKNMDAVNDVKVVLKELTTLIGSLKEQQEKTDDEVREIRKWRHDFSNHVQVLLSNLELKLMNLFEAR